MQVWRMLRRFACYLAGLFLAGLISTLVIGGRLARQDVQARLRPDSGTPEAD